uniref:Uncharacterized protein n=1 Tax=Cannabis sativa TaxID=3483 RepID=A0A803PVJ0_CANSA
MDLNQSTRSQCELVEPGNDQINPSTPPEDELRRFRQPTQAAPVEQVLPPAPVLVVGNPGFVLAHRDSVFEPFVKLYNL